MNQVDSLVNHRANNTSLLLFLEIHYCFSEDNDEKEKSDNVRFDLDGL